MKTDPIVPASLDRRGDGVPHSAIYGDAYHPRAGALTQARHVFMGGNELPQRWQGRDHFTVLETGFGLGNNFLSTWLAWRNDPLRCRRLVFISIERHPLALADLTAAHAGVSVDADYRDCTNELLAAWPPLTHNLHSLRFDDGKVQLLLALGDVQTWLPELVARVDAFYLDGFAPEKNPQMWSDRVCKALGRLAAPDATVTTWTAAHSVRASLATAGFDVRPAEGVAGQGDITLARYAPRFVPRQLPARGLGNAATPSRALVVGAGLAGCATAWALAELGWHSTLIDRCSAPASEASGNPAGLFHGIVNGQDGTHARFNRAAALAAHAAVDRAVREHRVQGSTNGLLRLESELSVAAMDATLRRLGLPTDYVRALTADAASSTCGLALRQPAWFYPMGGWVEPNGLARSFLERAGPKVALRMNTGVHRLERTSTGWALFDAAGAVIDEAPTLILANADGAARLLAPSTWPLQRLRGQISGWAESSNLRPPRTQMPIAGAGYLLPPLNGTVWFGATSQPDDDDGSVRDADHLSNLTQLQRLAGVQTLVGPDELSGRTGWRCSAADRLPIVGAVPDLGMPAGTTPDQPRLVPRLPGLYVLTALGSRGITWSALAAQVLAAWVSGTPMPIEASLIDSVDPARFAVRARRRASGE